MKKFRYIALSIACAFCAIFTGCKEDPIPADVMDEAEMISFLKDAYILEGFYAVETHFQYDTLQADILQSYDSLLTLHKITRDDFERSIKWYTEHTERYERVHKEVVAQLDAELAEEEIENEK